MRWNPVPADLCHVYEFENICKFSKNWHAIESWWVSQTKWKNGQEEFFEKEVAQMASEKKFAKWNRSYSKSNQLNHSVTFELEWKKWKIYFAISSLRRVLTSNSMWAIYICTIYSDRLRVVCIVCSSHYIFSL